MRTLRSATICAMLTMACAGPGPRVAVDGPPADLREAAAALYEQYGAALSSGRREALARFYHHDGALIVLNGVASRQSRDTLRHRYRTLWRPPAYFAWEDLAYDPISESQVLVTGGFRWLAPGRTDTTRYVYAALLVAVDSGLAIVFEHETRRPSPR